MTAAATPILPRNPHFDDQRVIWSDAFSGAYESVAYDEQFDDQWRLFLERKTGFCDHTGVETSDEYIDDRIAELTGVRDVLYRRKWGVLATLMAKLSGRSARQERRGIGGRLWLEPKFPLAYFEGKRCLDAGCGDPTIQRRCFEVQHLRHSLTKRSPARIRFHALLGRRDVHA